MLSIIDASQGIFFLKIDYTKWGDDERREPNGTRHQNKKSFRAGISEAGSLEGKTIVEAVFGIIIAIEESSDPETIARMINAYFNS